MEVGVARRAIQTLPVVNRGLGITGRDQVFVAVTTGNGKVAARQQKPRFFVSG